MVLENSGIEIIGDTQKICDYGDSLSFSVSLVEGYEITDISYGYYDYENSLLIVEDVSSQLSITISTSLINSSYTIDYYLNGATSFNNSTEKIIHRYYDPSIRLRPNTLRYDEVSPLEGKTLIGWNTKADFTGEDIGLGSRVTINSERSLSLYAKFETWSDSSAFSYEEKNNGISITGYHGQEEKIVIPDTINEKKVLEIAKGAFADLDFIDTVIINPSMEAIRGQGFRNVSLETLCFFDNLKTVSDESFTDCQNLKYVHVNAQVAPKYTKEWTNSFADKFDRVFLAREKKQMVFFGGSSMPYGLSSLMVDKEFALQYVVTDLWLSYLINPGMQFEILDSWLSDGDILVHAPEDMTEKVSWNEFSDLTWRVLEFNYDLVSKVDISRHTSIFTSFNGYNGNRRQLKATSYNEKSRTYNEYGDLSTFRPNTDNTDKGYDIVYSATQLKDSVLSSLDSIYDGFVSKGITVYFSYGPANLDGNKIPTADVRALYDLKVRKFITSCPIISQLEDYLFRGKYFSNTNYHMTSQGAELRTNQLIKDLKAQMKTDGII